MLVFSYTDMPDLLLQVIVQHTVLVVQVVVYKDKLPDEWYIEGDNLFLMQRIDGVDQVSGFAMGNLHKFLLKKELLNAKNWLTSQQNLWE